MGEMLLSCAFELRKGVTEVGCAPREVVRSCAPREVVRSAEVSDKAHSANPGLGKTGSANCLTRPRDTVLARRT